MALGCLIYGPNLLMLGSISFLFITFSFHILIKIDGKEGVRLIHTSLTSISFDGEGTKVHVSLMSLMAEN